jgi:hypothetical protein
MIESTTFTTLQEYYEITVSLSMQATNMKSDESLKNEAVLILIDNILSAKV